MAAPDADFDVLLGRQAELIDVIEAHDAWELDSRLDQAMDALRLPPGDADVTKLSGGERRRVALCKLLLQQPDLLLLDEPTNHLDAESVAWLEQHLAKYPGAVLAVTHDRYFLDNVAQWILELDRGRAYPYEGNYSDVPGDQAVAPEGGGKQGRQAPAPARPGARVGAFEPEGAPGEEQGAARPLRGARRRGRSRTRPMDWEEIHIPPGPRLGSQVIEAIAPRARASATASSSTTCRSTCLAAASSASSVRTGSARPRCSQMLVGQQEPDDRASSIIGADGRHRLRRSGTRSPARSRQERLGDRVRRAEPHQRRQDRDAEPGLRLLVRLQGPGSAEAGRRAFRRRAQPAEPRAHPQARRQSAAARRADQRPRRRDPALPRRTRCWSSPAAPW